MSPAHGGDLGLFSADDHRMNKETLQDRLFDAIQEQFDSRANLVDDLGRTLGIARDGIYRRLRRQTFLTLEELELLAKTYKVSLDSLLFRDHDTVLFAYNALHREVRTFDDYLESIREPLERVRAIPGLLVRYASLEIPIFYYCFFPELISFKLYVWGRATWDIPFTRTLPFSPDRIAPDTLELAGSILRTYLELPSQQIWSLNFFDHTLNQIEYHAMSGLFERLEDAFLLLDRMAQLGEHMRVMAACGRKSYPGADSPYATLEIYHNEMLNTNNTILVVSPSFRGVFSTFCNPNFLFTADHEIVAHTTAWFDQVLDKANPLTLTNEKARNWYFDRLRDKVEAARERIGVEVRTRGTQRFPE